MSECRSRIGARSVRVGEGDFPRWEMKCSIQDLLSLKWHFNRGDEVLELHFIERSAMLILSFSNAVVKIVKSADIFLVGILMFDSQ